MRHSWRTTLGRDLGIGRRITSDHACSTQLHGVDNHILGYCSWLARLSSHRYGLRAVAARLETLCILIPPGGRDRTCSKRRDLLNDEGSHRLSLSGALCQGISQKAHILRA
eukprot:scaffold155846_cov33-Tisochrysis_lutea.AAC.3